MEADCQWKNLVWRLSPSRGLGRKINEQDRSSIESEDKSRCSDRYFGVFYDNSRNCTNGNAYCKIHTIMRLGRILGPISSFLIRHFLYLCAICAWPSQSLKVNCWFFSKYLKCAAFSSHATYNQFIGKTTPILTWFGFYLSENSWGSTLI